MISLATTRSNCPKCCGSRSNKLPGAIEMRFPFVKLAKAFRRMSARRSLATTRAPSRSRHALRAASPAATSNTRAGFNLAASASVKSARIRPYANRKEVVRNRNSIPTDRPFWHYAQAGEPRRGPSDTLFETTRKVDMYPKSSSLPSSGNQASSGTDSRKAVTGSDPFAEANYLAEGLAELEARRPGPVLPGGTIALTLHWLKSSLHRASHRARTLPREAAC